MPRYVTVAPHLPVDELASRYRAASHPVERTHWHILWLVATGRRVPEVARLVSYTANWVREIIRRYNADGPAGVIDRRQHSAGQPPLLPPAGREAFARSPRGTGAGRRALDGPQGCHLDGGPPRTPGASPARLGGVADARLHPPTAPPACHQRRSGRPGDLQKGGLQAQIDAIHAAHPTARLTVWAEDEHRLGLLPVVRRVWAPRGQRPTAWTRRRYQWCYVLRASCGRPPARAGGACFRP